MYVYTLQMHIVFTVFWLRCMCRVTNLIIVNIIVS